MPVHIEIETYEEHIVQIVRTVFGTMLQCEVSSEPAGVTLASSDVVTAAIYLAGSWKGAVILECTRKQAFDCTARLMRIALPEAVNDDVCDAMGEVVNMVGGNLKSVLPHGVEISMPIVVEGADYMLRICGANRHHHTSFVSDSGPLRVTLVEVRNSL